MTTTLSPINAFDGVGKIDWATQSDLSYFYPEEIKTLKTDILSPEQFFGMDIGEIHLSYENISSYFQYLASVSPRIYIQSTGTTFEHRPFLSLVIGSPANIKKVKEAYIKERPGRDLFGEDILINWLGYTVHGNEASGINASVVVAYLMAAGEGPYIDKLINNSITLLLPALNPDGASRYATDANVDFNYAKNLDRNNREFRFTRPSARSNHYWFDLNRDWLMTQQPEGQSIIELFHEWRPNVVGDYHEHGSTRGTFFSPGLITSTNNFIPIENWHLTGKIAAYHEEYLNRVGMVYFSREGYDDFYPGKGGCYPDFFGSIGILYEQINSRGLNRVINGVELSLRVSTRNQVYCSFSTLTAAIDLQDELFDYRKKFKERVVAANNLNISEAYILEEGRDPSVMEEFLSLIERHKIEYYPTFDDSKKRYNYLIPINQSSMSIIKDMFEPRHNFIDTLFYDISAWTMPMAFNINYSKSTVDAATLSRLKEEKQQLLASSSTQGVAPSSKQRPITSVTAPQVPAQSDYGYLFEMDDYYSYNFLYYLQSRGVIVKGAGRKFNFEVADGVREFSVGTIFIPTGNQQFDSDHLYSIIEEYFLQHAKSELVDFSRKRGFVAKGRVKVYPIEGSRGVEFDLGNRSFTYITLPKIAMIVGTGTTYSAIGELWQLLDYHHRIPVTLLDRTSVSAETLEKYNVIILRDNLSFGKKATREFVDWATRDKNTLITIAGGVRFAVANELISLTFPSLGSRGNKNSLAAYEDRSVFRRDRPVTGLILESKIDLTHPLAVGLENETLPVFKRTDLLASAKGVAPGMVFSRITKDPVLSGYMAAPVVKKVANRPHIIATEGILFFPDNPNFRGYWRGTSRVFMNSLFYREML